VQRSPVFPARPGSRSHPSTRARSCRAGGSRPAARDAGRWKPQPHDLEQCALRSSGAARDFIGIPHPWTRSGGRRVIHSRAFRSMARGGRLDTLLAALAPPGSALTVEEPETDSISGWTVLRAGPGLRGGVRLRARAWMAAARPASSTFPDRLDHRNRPGGALGTRRGPARGPGRRRRSGVHRVSPSDHHRRRAADQVLIHLPKGYGTPAITGVRVAGFRARTRTRVSRAPRRGKARTAVQALLIEVRSAPPPRASSTWPAATW
jgi:hypothetical protein